MMAEPMLSRRHALPLPHRRRAANGVGSVGVVHFLFLSFFWRYMYRSIGAPPLLDNGPAFTAGERVLIKGNRNLGQT